MDISLKHSKSSALLYIVHVQLIFGETLAQQALVYVSLLESGGTTVLNVYVRVPFNL